MENKKHGGKRVGSGRKPLPITQKRTTLNIYPTNAELYKFGDKDKMVKEVKKFIAEYGVRDLSKPTNEIKPFEQPKTNYQASVAPPISQPVINQEGVYIQELRSAKTIPEIQAIVKAIKSDVYLGVPTQKKLEQYAIELSKNMYND